jgi:hypothetical protein
MDKFYMHTFSRMNSKYKHPIEYELIPDSLERGTHYLTLRLKNRGDDTLQYLNVKMHSLDSFHISFRNPNDYIHKIEPDKDEYLNFQVDANVSSHLYVSIVGRKNGHHFHWDSPLLKEVVLGDPAEIESIFVSNPYGKIGRELDVEAVIVAKAVSSGLTLSFWTDKPSGICEEIADIKTRHMSKGEEVSYTGKMTPKEEGYYTVYASLYDDYRLIDRDYDIIWVER